VQVVAGVLAVGFLLLLGLAPDPTAGDPQQEAATPARQSVPVPPVELPRGVDESSTPEQGGLFRDVSRQTGVAGRTGSARLDVVEVPVDEAGSRVVRDALVEGSTWTRLMAGEGYFISGQAWGDYDRDGFVDLYLTNQDGPNRLLRNVGGRRFEASELGEAVALADEASGGATWVDVDNDGWPDLHVLGDGPDHLFRNQRGRGFVDVTEQAGIQDLGEGMTAAWADVDGNGFLDAYVVNYGCQPCFTELPVPVEARDQDHLFLNRGDGTFDDVTASIDQVPGTRGLGFAATWTDYDLDGDPDLYVVNDVRNDRADAEVAAGQAFGDGTTPGNLLLRNDGAGCEGWCFTDVSEPSGAGVRANAMGLAVGDVDADGDPDLFMSNSGWRAGPTILLENRGDGTFEDVSRASGADVGAWSWGASFLDVDNDARLDAFLAVGYSELLYQARADAVSDSHRADVPAARAEVARGDLPVDVLAELPADLAWPVAEDEAGRTDNNRVLLQQEDGSFRVTPVGPTDELVPVHYGTAVGDYDNDGWPDVVVGKLGDGYLLLRNEAGAGSANHRVVVTVEGDGRRVNRDGVGARVTLVDEAGGRQTREVQIGASLGAGADRRLFFGLGAARGVALEVWWPDGTTEVHRLDVTDAAVTLRLGEDPGASPLAPSG